ncbi:hypothetical protein [Acaryochloris sp. CCMEE 5410]|uniref:hypothetical protein n=1 Tax=Acaryochloris sp. CCMEE 5410 TaxID=310037 RepID=UPI0002485162|nr:hypothetical protein [Acaryochloris sp. CCMEE 5410]KAI9130143.1 hypothetical protein ON05_031440 [Acaryochloris sp. CCMEE 5410]
MPSYDFQSRIQVSSDSPYATTLKYLKSSQTVWPDSKRMLLVPTFAYWHPFALQALGNDPAQVRQAALNSIRELESHCYYLRQTFGIENAANVTPSSQSTDTSPRDQPMSSLMSGVDDDLIGSALL